MALPTIKVACSNGHFQESILNFGDRGTWTDVGSYSGGETVLTDLRANWVDDEWIGYRIRADVNDANTIAEVVDNTENTITVNSDLSGLTAGTDTYRIGAGLVGTANASNSTTVTLTSITNKYGATIAPKADELIGMTIVPDKLDGTGYTITDNSAVTTGSMTVTIGTAVTVSSTGFEIGRGASASLYPDTLTIDAEINEPKQLSASVPYDISTFENETSLTNPLQLGATVRVTESTGNKILFEGLVHECPTDINYEEKLVSFTAYDKLSIMDYTIIPGTKITDAGALPSFNWTKSTPLIESGLKGWQSDNKIFQTKAFQDYTYVSQPLGIPIATTNTDGTWTMLGITNTVTNSDVIQYSTGGFQSDLIAKGSVCINFTQKKITYVEEINSDTQITTIDSIWNTSDKFAILSKNWQVGAGVVLDSDYSAGSGWGMNAITREALAAPTASDDGAAPDEWGKTRIYVGTSAGADTYISFTGRAWVIMFKTDHSTTASRTKFEFAHYNGYLKDFSKGKYFLNCFNTAPETDRNTRGDLTNSWKTSDTDEYGIAWDAGTYVLEVFPNRFGGSPPSIFWDANSDPLEG